MTSADRDDEVERHLREALHLLAAQRTDDADATLRRVLALDPARALAWNALGTVHRMRGAGHEAEACFRRAIELAPDHAAAHLNLGLLLGGRHRHVDAAAAYRRALSLVPSWGQAHRALAAALMGQGRLPEAEAAARRSSAHDPHAAALGPLLASILMAKAQALRQARDHAGALCALREAETVHPDLPGSRALRHLVAREACAWDEADALAGSLLRQARAEGDACLLGPDIVTWNRDARLHLQVARCWIRAATVGAQPRTPRPPPASRLQVAYLSADFRDHATLHLTAGLFRRHDRTRFCVTVYAYGPPDPSGARQRLADSVEQLVDLEALSDAQAAQRIETDGVHVLVDLKGLTAGARPGILAHRPAPVQVTWLGYPGSTGASFIDYLVGDAVVTPARDAALFSEQLVRLPHSYQVTDEDALVAAAPSRRVDVGLPAQAVVLACFAHPYKITRDVFSGWLGLLRDVPSTVLWLYDHNHLARKHLERAAHDGGVNPTRLHFAPWVPKPVHMARLALADLVLDTLPCNGHTTTSDALKAGVPVLTARGVHFAGRVSESLLRATGMSECVADDLSGLLDAGRRLAADPAALAALRARLADVAPAAPLFDTGRTTRALEWAYEAMWARAVAGQPPAPMDIRDPGPSIRRQPG